MKEEDYDVNDFIAGLVMHGIEEEDDNSQMYLDDNSFFEEVEGEEENPSNVTKMN